jgi:hypothetical protein
VWREGGREGERVKGREEERREGECWTFVATPPLCFAEVVQGDTDQLSACGAGKRFTVHSI